VGAPHRLGLRLVRRNARHKALVAPNLAIDPELPRSDEPYRFVAVLRFELVVRLGLPGIMQPILWHSGSPTGDYHRSTLAQDYPK